MEDSMVCAPRQRRRKKNSMLIGGDEMVSYTGVRSRRRPNRLPFWVIRPLVNPANESRLTEDEIHEIRERFTEIVDLVKQAHDGLSRTAMFFLHGTNRRLFAGVGYGATPEERLCISDHF